MKMRSIDLKLFSLLSIFLLFCSCSSSDASGDAEALLQTVPADASVVAVLDLESIIDHSGGKAKGAEMKDGRQLKEAIARLDKKGDATRLFDGEASVSLTAAVYFTSGGNSYLTFRLEDAEKFREYVAKREKESNPSAEWSKDGDIYRLGAYAQTGEQGWLMMNQRSDAPIADFAELTKARSFLSNEYAATLSACEHDAQWYASINGLLDAAGISFGDRTTIRLASSMLFDNATALAGYAQLDDKDLDITLDVIATDGKPAKCNLKFGKIDIAQVAALGGNANTIFAIDMPHKLVEQLLKSAESFGGSMPTLYKNVLTPIDGTVAVASSGSADISNAPFIASIATSGNAAPLMQTLFDAGYKPVSEGDLLKFSSGNYGDGAFSVADASKDMEGASMAVVCRDAKGYDVKVKLAEHKSGLRLEASVTPKGNADYFLVNLLNSMK